MVQYSADENIRCGERKRVEVHVIIVRRGWLTRSEARVVVFCNVETARVGALMIMSRFPSLLQYNW